MELDPKRVLAQPYARKFIPDPEGGYVGTIHEFPGLVAEGETLVEASENLEAAAESWLEAQLDAGQPIKPPVDFFGYSGKIALRLPRGLHKQASELAELESTSLNQLIVSAVAMYVGGISIAQSLAHEVAVRAESISPSVTTIFVRDRRGLHSNRDTSTLVFPDFQKLIPAPFSSTILEIG